MTKLHLAQTPQKPMLHTVMLEYQTRENESHVILEAKPRKVLWSRLPHQPQCWSLSKLHYLCLELTTSASCPHLCLCAPLLPETALYRLVKGLHGTQQSFRRIPLEFLHKICLIGENLHQMKKKKHLKEDSKGSFYIYRQFLMPERWKSR